MWWGACFYLNIFVLWLCFMFFVSVDYVFSAGLAASYIVRRLANFTGLVVPAQIYKCVTLVLESAHVVEENREICVYVF